MTKTNRYFNATRIAMIALFSALSGILYIFGFPVSAIFPSWLELNFSDIPALIGTFALGPVSGALIVLFKILVKLMFKPSSTMFVGELADLLVGVAFLIPAGMIYRKKRTFCGALVGMGVGTVCSVATGILMNWLVLIPFYIRLYFGGSWEPLLGMMRSLFPSVTQENFYSFYLWASVLPFNLLRCLIAVLVTLPVYKHVSRAINRLDRKLAPQSAGGAKGNRKNIVIGVACAVLLAAVLAVVILRAV